MKKIRSALITGAGGFAGRHLIPRLTRDGFDVGGVVRSESSSTPPSLKNKIVCDLASEAPPANEFAGFDIVIHMAAKAHDNSATPEDFARDTVRVSENVAKAAVAAKVPYFVHISSIGARVAEKDINAARDYGKAKLAAEKRIQEIYLDNAPGNRLVTLRPPAIYGPSAPGAFGTLEKFISRKLPLPFGLARNQRSYLSIDNMVDLISSMLRANDNCWDRANAMSFEPHDGKNISTRDLCQEIARVQGRKLILIPVPHILMSLLGRIAGKSSLVSGAFDELASLDAESLQNYFDWTPVEQIPSSLEFLVSKNPDLH